LRTARRGVFLLVPVLRVFFFAGTRLVFPRARVAAGAAREGFRLAGQSMVPRQFGAPQRQA
jgi:hypothetical protein